MVEEILVDKATVYPSALLINALSKDINVQAIEHRLNSSKVRLSVLNGCEGTETMLLLIAAVLAFKASWKQKLVGIVTGLILIYVLNQIRIATLFFILPVNKQMFYAIHGYIGPTLILVLSCIFFLMWIRKVTLTKYESDTAG